MSIIVRLRLILLLLVLKITCQATISDSTIQSDAAEINILNEILTYFSPDIFHESVSHWCEMIDKCCWLVKPHLADYIDGTIHGSSALLNACIAEMQYQSSIANCLPLAKFASISQDEDLDKYFDTLNSITSKIQDYGIVMPQKCSSEEIYAEFCDQTKWHMMESCERKRLLYVAAHQNDNDYYMYVRNKKNILLSSINAINKAFPMINITGTMTTNTTVRIKANLLQ